MPTALGTLDSALVSYILLLHTECNMQLPTVVYTK